MAKKAEYKIVSVQETTQTGYGFEPVTTTLITFRTKEGNYDQVIIPKAKATQEEIEAAINSRLGK